MQNKKNKTSSVMIFGKHPVISALNNPRRKCLKLYITKNIWDEIKNSTPDLKIPIQFCSSQELSAILPKESNHQNIILEASPLNTTDLEDILDEIKNKSHSCILILDQITDPHNIGAILRSAAAFAADAVILLDHNSPKENNTIIKCAAGASEIIPLIYVNNLVNCINTLKKNDFWVIGLDGHTEVILNQAIFSPKQAFILGAEGSGMRKLTKENCDHIAKISITKTSESLNVSNAAAIALYQFSQYNSITS